MKTTDKSAQNSSVKSQTIKKQNKAKQNKNYLSMHNLLQDTMMIIHLVTTASCEVKSTATSEQCSRSGRQTRLGAAALAHGNKRRSVNHTFFFFFSVLSFTMKTRLKALLVWNLQKPVLRPSHIPSNIPIHIPRW